MKFMNYENFLKEISNIDFYITSKNLQEIYEEQRRKWREINGVKDLKK